MNLKIVISEKAHHKTFDYFKKKGFDIIRFPDQRKPYEAVSHHPDMFMFYDDFLFIEKGIPLEGVKCELLGERYPETVKYNIAKVSNSVICKYDAIDLTIKEHIKKKSYRVVDVKQGYAKCSTAVIGNSIITSDKGIYNACVQEQINSLLVRPGHIELPGLDYGFIGGTCVTFGDTVFFNGEINRHPDYESIKSFIDALNKNIEYINIPLTDIGSLIIIERSE